MQTGKLTIVALAALTLFTHTAMAGTNTATPPKPHTWHTVSTNKGVWDGRLQIINENGSFVSRDGSPMTTFTISPNQPQDFGFLFTPDADFDIAYTLTLTERDSKNFSSKACVYVITAAGPANPDIRPSSYNGAKCDWQVVHGKGEDFFVG